MCGIELVRARCDRFLVIRLSGCLPLCRSARSIQYRKRRGGRAARRGGGAEMCLNWRRVQRICTAPPRCSCVEEGGGHFSCCETLPHVISTPPQTSLSPLFTFTLSLSSFYSTSVMSERHFHPAHDHIPAVIVLKAVAPGGDGTLVAAQHRGEFACSVSNKQICKVFDFTV